MFFSGIQQFTMLDFPDTIACILFIPGCNFRCGYCHNPEFVLPEQLIKIKDSFITEESAFNFLKQRLGKLEGVVFSGGEPTIMPDLVDCITKVKALGFKVKLDSNGNKPEVIQELLQKKLLDYIAMDIKTSLAQYKSLVGNLADTVALQKSIDLIKSSGIPYEFRTTLTKETHTPEILKAMIPLLSGSKKYTLQHFRPEITLDPAFASNHDFTATEMEEIKNIFAPHVEKIVIL
jgi:pyruvate formate lyase activating enzyme